MEADAAVLAGSGVLLAVLELDEPPQAAAPTVMAPIAPMAASERSVRDVVIKEVLSKVVS